MAIPVQKITSFGHGCTNDNIYLSQQRPWLFCKWLILLCQYIGIYVNSLLNIGHKGDDNITVKFTLRSSQEFALLHKPYRFTSK